MGAITWILGLAGIVILVMYVLAPIIVGFQVRMAARPDVRRIDPAEIDPEAATFFETTRPALTALGFQPVGSFFIEEFARNQLWLLDAYAHPRNRDTASANFVIQNVAAGGRPLKATAVAFTTDFEGGRMFGTSNSPDPSPFTRDSSLVCERVVPAERDLGRAYRVHGLAAEDFGRGYPKRLPGPGNEINAIRETLRKQMEARVETGYFTRDTLTESYRPTLSGAFLMTWALLWPWKQIRIANARRWARSILASAPPESLEARSRRVAESASRDR